MNNSTGATAGRDFDPYAPYRGRLLPNERVRELSRLRPARAIIDALGCWLVIGAAWAAVALGSPWWTLLAVPVIGTRFYALFIIGHDGLHRRVFNESRWNDLFCDLVIFAPIGAITRINNRNHLMHHWHLSTSRDPDRHRHACFNKYSRSGFVAFLTGTSTARTSARNVFLNRDEDGIGETEGGRRYQLRDAVALLSWQAVLIGGLSWGIGWWAYPVLWILPIGLFTALGDNVRAFAEHSHPEADAAADAHGRGFRIHTCPVEDCEDIEDGSLDLVTMFYVIEHVAEPGAVVRKIRRWLVPGGILAVETPNWDSLDARLFESGFWGGYHVPRHWNLFIPSTLERMLSASGLELVATLYQTGHAFWMYSFHHKLKYGRRPRRRLAGWFDPFASLPFLALFTAFDKVRAGLGFRTSSMLMLAKKSSTA